MAGVYCGRSFVISTTVEQESMQRTTEASFSAVSNLDSVCPGFTGSDALLREPVVGRQLFEQLDDPLEK
jgi:hypothetical protein